MEALLWFLQLLIALGLKFSVTIETGNGEARNMEKKGARKYCDGAFHVYGRQNLLLVKNK